jgi:hypothetical protein
MYVEKFTLFLRRLMVTGSKLEQHLIIFEIAPMMKAIMTNNNNNNNGKYINYI